ncbi:MAG: serine/threonine-protein phosphatase [Lentisphaeria bacterium]|nr:serine/threonine-protein phosphatase [Lentisphaeria bacterium]
MNINFAQLEIAGETNIGTVRHHNEDNFIIYAPPGGEAVLAAVADGIGGHSRGEVASHICCSELLRAARRTDNRKWDKDFLLNTLLKASDHIFTLNYKNKREKPMGCTVAAVIFFRDRFIWASAGDSRIYEFLPEREKKPLLQLTTDHRPENFRKLHLDPRFRNLSLISRSLGTVKHLQIDIAEYKRQDDAKYLICSDGLYSHVSEQTIAGVLADENPMRKKTGELVKRALMAREKDNITIICAGTAEKKDL